LSERETLPLTRTGKAGFFYGYVIVAFAFIIMTVAGGTLFTFGVFFKPLLAEFGWTRAATSGAFSLFMIVHGGLYIITGRLTDRVGPRVVLSGCGFFLGLGYVLMSQTSAIWHLYLSYGVVAAIGMSAALIPVASTVARWFVRRRGVMTGIALSGVGVGTMVMPPVAIWLISSYGWRTSYEVMGLMALVIIIAAAQFLKRDPAQVGQLPDGRNEVPEESLNLEVGGFSFQQVVCTRQFWLICVAYFGLGLFMQSIMVHIVPHIIELGIPAAAAANVLVVIGGLSIAGRLFMGSAGDRIGNRSVLVIGFALAAAALAWLLVAGEMWMLYLFAIIFGVAYGSIAVVESPLVADLFGLSSHGVILGWVSFIIALGSAVGPVLSGYIFDVTGSYNLAFLICAVAGATGLISILLLKSTRREEVTNEP